MECINDVFDTSSVARNKMRRVGILEHKFEPSGVQAVYKVTVKITRTGLDAHVDHTWNLPIEGPPLEIARYMRNVDWDIGAAYTQSGGTTTRNKVSMKWTVHPDYFNSGLETLVHLSTRAHPDAHGLLFSHNRHAEVQCFFHT
jgi:hypothetical protein